MKILLVMWASLMSLRTPLICTISPKEPCFIIKIFDISYLNLVNEFSTIMTNKSKKILTEISAGELLDKISILEIKLDNIKDKDKLIEVNKEYKSLEETKKSNIEINENLEKLVNQLKEINLKLWNIEEQKRLCEKNSDFGKNFIQLSRNVYLNNDKRAKIKSDINKLLGSNIKEVKSY